MAVHTATKRISIRNHWLIWHRWIGLVACIGMVLWGLSGASHPIMSRLQPIPDKMVPPLQEASLGQAKALPQVLAENQVRQFSHISLAHVHGVSYYRVGLPDQPQARYFNIHSGEMQPEMERAHAIALACYYTGLPASAVATVRHLDAFEADYHPINRLLPVWRVQFNVNGNLRAYVDTEQSRLATLVDDRRAMLTAWFQFGHQWSFMHSAGTLQLLLATFMLGLIVASAITGLTLYVRHAATARYRLRRFSLQWWHRQLGLWVALIVLLLASSGLWHLWQSDAQQNRPPFITQHLAESTALSPALWQQLLQVQTKVQKLDIYGRGQQVFWQVVSTHAAMPKAQVAVMRTQTPGHEHHPQAAGRVSAPSLYWSEAVQLIPLDIADYAKLWAEQLADQHGQQLKSTDWIYGFANEYGFIFKRLPVLKLQTAASDGQRWYVEPATGTLAASLNHRDALEGFVFAYFHKWSLKSLPKDVRDACAVLAALLIAALGVMGAILFYRQRIPR